MNLNGISTILTVTAYLVLVIAPWPMYRLISIPSLWREYFCVAIRAVLLILLYFAVILASGLLVSEIILPLAVVAACALIAERWRARETFGVRKGLPPGSLSLVPRGPWVDERFFAKQAAKYGPVFKMSQYFRPMVCVIGPREALSLFQQHSDKLIAPPVRYSAFIPNGFLRFMDAAAHKKYRPIFRNAFSKVVFQSCAPYFEDVIKADLSAMASASREKPGKGVHPLPYASAIVFKLIVRLFIGVHARSDEFLRLQKLYQKVVIGKVSCRLHSGDIEAANAIAKMVSRQAELPRQNLPPCFLAEIARQNTEAVHDRTVQLNLVYMMQIATSDLSGLLAWAIKLLIDNPHWADRLRDATGRSEAEGKRVASLVLKEVLRVERSEFIFRKTMAPIEYKGFTIPHNWIVRVCIRDGHRDSETFENPHTFNPDRFAGKTYTREEYSPLGVGAHACIGGQVIDAIGSAFLIEWTRSYQVRSLSDGPREYGRSHWQPSSALRVELSPP